MDKQRIAVYPLSADPIHNGHAQNFIKGALQDNYDKMYVTVASDVTKRYLFTVGERLELVKKAIMPELKLHPEIKSEIEVDKCEGLLRNYAVQKGIGFIIKGYRNSMDLDYEEMQSAFNGEFGLETRILPANNTVKWLSSTIVKSVVSSGGLVHDYVHPAVKQALEERINERSLIGVTGSMGSGKSYFCRKLAEHALFMGQVIHHIDFDKIMHSLYEGDSAMSIDVLQKIRTHFGESVFDGGTLNRKKLAAVIFSDKSRRDELVQLLKIPATIKLEEELSRRKGIVLADAAYLTEYGILPIVNYNVILVTCDKDERYCRKTRAGLTSDEIDARESSQHDQDMKRDIILEQQRSKLHGFFYEAKSGQFDFGNALHEINTRFPSF